jgi:hypothetical protein
VRRFPTPVEACRGQPKLMKAFRADKLNLDQLMAFTLVDDHKVQEKVWRD